MAEDEWIDAGARERLIAGVFGSAAIAQRFFDDFVVTWRGRIERVARGLDASDSEDVYVALLSIRSTSEMVGALPLAQLARKLEGLAQSERLDECRAALGELRRIGELTVRALAEWGSTH